MSDLHPRPDPARPREPSVEAAARRGDDRSDRLKRALRDNLARRKAQSRARRADAGPDAEADTPDG